MGVNSARSTASRWPIGYLGDGTVASFYRYSRRLDDVTVRDGACDSLYRKVTKLSFFAVSERWLIYA